MGNVLGGAFQTAGIAIGDAFVFAGGAIASEATMLGTEIEYMARLQLQFAEAEAAYAAEEAKITAEQIGSYVQQGINEGISYAGGVLNDVGSVFGRRRLAQVRCAAGTFSFSTSSGVSGGGGAATQASLASLFSTFSAVNVSLCAGTTVAVAAAPLYVNATVSIACSATTSPPSCALDGGGASRVIVVAAGSLTLVGVSLQARAAASLLRGCAPHTDFGASARRTALAPWAARLRWAGSPVRCPCCAPSPATPPPKEGAQSSRRVTTCRRARCSAL